MKLGPPTFLLGEGMALAKLIILPHVAFNQEKKTNVTKRETFHSSPTNFEQHFQRTLLALCMATICLA